MNQEIKSPEVIRYAILSQGAEHKMYTLWTWNSGSHYVKEQYIKNLSTDHDTAIKLAQEFADKSGRIFVDDSMDELNPILRCHKWSRTQVRFGKNRGMELAECEPKFITWVAKGCPLYDERHEVWCNHFFGGSDFCEYAKQLAVSMNLGVVENDKFYTMDAYEKMQERKRQAALLVNGHHCDNGKRVELELTLLNIFGYDSAFGYVNVYKFKDGDNRVFTYKGTSYLRKPVITSYEGEQYTEYENVKVGDTFKVKATIKHDSYKGEATTYIQRVMVTSKPIVNTIEPPKVDEKELSELKDLFVGKMFTRRDYIDPNGQQSKWSEYIITNVEIEGSKVTIFNNTKALFVFTTETLEHYKKTQKVISGRYTDDSSYSIREAEVSC